MHSSHPSVTVFTPHLAYLHNLCYSLKLEASLALATAPMNAYLPLLPHRNPCNCHMFVNQLSLASEQQGTHVATCCPTCVIKVWAQGDRGDGRDGTGVALESLKRCTRCEKQRCFTAYNDSTRQSSKGAVPELVLVLAVAPASKESASQPVLWRMSKIFAALLRPCRTLICPQPPFAEPRQSLWRFFQQPPSQIATLVRAATAPACSCAGQHWGCV